MMVISGFLLSLVMAVLLCWHAVKTGRNSMWLWIILMFQPLTPVATRANVQGYNPGIVEDTYFFRTITKS